MRRNRRRAVVTLGVLALGALASGCAVPSWQVDLVSVNAAGTDSGNRGSGTAVFSADGTKVAFHSDARDLVANDGNLSTDIFVRDLTTGVTTLVSLDANGGPANNSSYRPTFSPDGTKVAFHSQAQDLLPGTSDPDLYADVFVHELTTGITTRVSINADHTGGGNGTSDSPAFSPDGTNIAFRSEADNLVPTDVNRTEDIFLYDLAAGMTTAVSSPDVHGRQTGSSASWTPSFSSDGSRVAFATTSWDLDRNDTNRYVDIYIRDLDSGKLTLVSKNPAGIAGNQGSNLPQFSPDGTHVLFHSRATDFGPTDANGVQDVYVADLATGAVSLVSTNGDETGAAAGYSGSAAFSPDASKVVFNSTANDLGWTDTNGTADTYLRDLVAGTTTLVSADTHGDAAGGALLGATPFAGDGTKVVFSSTASTFGPPDANGLADVYVRDLETRSTTLVSANAAGDSGGNAASEYPVFAPAGDRLLFLSRATDLGPPDSNDDYDIYLAALT